jgi:hypothetical protein
MLHEVDSNKITIKSLLPVLLHFTQEGVTFQNEAEI